MSDTPPDTTKHTDLITIRLPLASWQGIVNGLEKWAGMSQFDPEFEILSDYEVLEPSSYAAWDRDIRVQAAREYADNEEGADV